MKYEPHGELIITFCTECRSMLRQPSLEIVNANIEESASMKFDHFIVCLVQIRSKSLPPSICCSGSRSRAWTKTFFWCILKRDKDSKNPGFQDLRFRSKTRHFQVWNCVERCSLSYFYADFKFEIVSVDVIWWNFMHFYADFKFEIVSIDAMYRMCMRF